TNGLVTFKTETGIVIWNPTIKEHITLLQPKISKHLGCFLGYDPKENTYKILSIAHFCKTWKKYQKPKILTLGSQESWRVITNSPDHYPTRRYYCINGVVYYISYEEYHKIYPPFIKEIEVDMRLNEIIMSFDVRSEQFKSIQLPARANQYESKLDESLMTYQGKLAWVCYNSYMIKLWVLQDLEKQEWSKNEFVLPNLPQRDLLGSAKLSGATSIGK
ncbi:F-box associated domain type 3, partial [Arabidopsis thaliana x Arabidopsis arenosa]